MNFRNPVVRKGSKRAFIHDALISLRFVVDQGVKVYLLNEVLVPGIAKGEFESDDWMKLVFVVLMFTLPGHFLQYVAHQRNLWKIGGGSRKLLQSNFLRKFMSYSPEAHKRVDSGEVILIMFDQIPEIVAKAYGSVFPLVQSTHQLIFIIIYQLMSPLIFTSRKADIGQVALTSLSVTAIFPIVMFLSLKLRSGKSLQLTFEAREAKAAASSFVIDVLDNLRMLSDYGKRGAIADSFDAKIGKYNVKRANHLADFTSNKFTPVSLSLLIQAGWILGGGAMLVQGTGGLDLGTFLANMSIFKMIGTCWSNIYQNLLNMQEVTREFRRVVRLMNLPSEAIAQRNFLDSCAKETTSRLSALESEQLSQSLGQGEAPYVDRLPIRMFELQHRFEDIVALSSVSLELKQGLLHGIAGSRRSGKSTVLRLIGGRALPNPDAPPNSLYVPQHLRTLHVSKDPLFFH